MKSNIHRSADILTVQKMKLLIKDFFSKCDQSQCSGPEMVHAILIPQPLEYSDEKHNHNTISQIFGTTLGSAKSSSTASKASPASVPNRLTMQEIINSSIHKSTYQKYLS